MTENRIFTLCRMITWVVFLRMFWNFISSLAVKRGGSLSFLVGIISNVLVMEIGCTDYGEREVYISELCSQNASYVSLSVCTSVHFWEWDMTFSGKTLIPKLLSGINFIRYTKCQKIGSRVGNYSPPETAYLMTGRSKIKFKEPGGRSIFYRYLYL
jgi:hypothetical protein